MISNTPWKKRIVIILIGLIANGFVIGGFDNVLYPLVMGTKGFVLGGIIMLCLSIILCFLILKFYDWSGRDWLGVETIKELREIENSKANRLIARFFKKSYWAQLIILSLAQNPFITTVFLRKGAHEYGSMTKSDWGNFSLSVLIGNVFWATVCWSGVRILEKVGMGLSMAISVLSTVLIILAIILFIISKINEKREKQQKVE